MEGVCAYGRGVYIWKYGRGGCVTMEGVCNYGRCVYLWKGCVLMEGVCT